MTSDCNFSQLDNSINKSFNESIDMVSADINPTDMSLNNSYHSMNSNSILANDYGSSMKDRNLVELDKNTNVFKNISRIYFYIEINYFCFWQKEYIQKLYPELNLILVIEINDNKLTQEKIIFVKEEDDYNAINLKKLDGEKKVHIYTPMKKKDDLNNNCYRMLSVVDYQDSSIPLKFTVGLCTYTNTKILPVGSSEFFVNIKDSQENIKHNIYSNLNMKHYHKKIGNLVFSYAFQTEEIHPLHISAIADKNIKIEEFSVNILFDNVENR
jgi:hypothetical protein